MNTEQPMIDIKETVKNPANAIELMFAGIRRQDERDDFVLDMDTRGCFDIVEGICFGCAATCTIQEIAGKNLVPEVGDADSLIARQLGFHPQELDDFEIAIDEARTASLKSLYSFFDLEPSCVMMDEPLCFDELNWRDKEPVWRDLVQEMRKLNPDWTAVKMHSLENV